MSSYTLFDLIMAEYENKVWVNPKDFSTCSLEKVEGYIELDGFENFFEDITDLENYYDLFCQVFNSNPEYEYGFLFWKNKESKYYLHELFVKFTGGSLAKEFQYYIEDRLTQLEYEEKEYLVSDFIDNLYSEVLIAS